MSDSDQHKSFGIIDTHSHIFQPDFDNDISDVIARAKQIGVTKILLPNIDVSTIDRVDSLAARYSDYCIPMMGLHPASVTENWQADLDIVKQAFARNKYCAVGEIGIDLYWDKSLETEQKLAFEEQLRWSIDFDLPVAIHSRNAIAECIECIEHVGADKLRGVFHSFGGTRDEMDAILALRNFYLGINGTLTFKNSTLREVLQHTNLNRLILETDSPYLAPVPYRGKRNESAYTELVAQKLSEVYGVSIVEVGNMTTANANELFGL